MSNQPNLKDYLFMVDHKVCNDVEGVMIQHKVNMGQGLVSLLWVVASHVVSDEIKGAEEALTKFIQEIKELGPAKVGIFVPPKDKH